MRKIVNFGAGPAMLPEEVLLQAQAEMLDWHGTGMSIMELGHRGPEFQELAAQIENDLRELMDIPEHYHVLFLAGGASTQFAMVPLNLFSEAKQADYIDTGIWSKKAIAEASRYGNVNIATQLVVEPDRIYIPSPTDWSLNPNADYVHYTPNETIEGVQFHFVPETNDVPLVADMTSMILSQPINVNNYGVIYAGAQKNISHAGLTIVIVREDLVKTPLSFTPTLYSYMTHVTNHSFYNTPPTYSWYMAGLTFAWLKRQGGVKAIAEMNQRKADKLYRVLDEYPDFYVNKIQRDYRSVMNVLFNLPSPELTQLFLEKSKELGLVYLRGHRLVGGIRASIYNAMPEEAVDKLVVFMQDFIQRWG